MAANRTRRDAVELLDTPFWAGTRLGQSNCPAAYSGSRSVDGSPQRYEPSSLQRSGPPRGPFVDFSRMLAPEVTNTRSSASESRLRSPERRGRPRRRANSPSITRTASRRTPGLPTIMEHRGATSSPPIRRRQQRGNCLQQWLPSSGEAVPWDGIRKDSELWLGNGDCLVHLYQKGHSKRGPSFKVPVTAIEDAGFSAIFNHFYTQKSPASPPSRRRKVDHGRLHPSSTIPSTELRDIFIPSPDGLSKAESYNWHVVTRNFFAFLVRKPLVGSYLGQTFIDLQNRLDLLRPGDTRNQEDVVEYLDEMGYLNFAHRADYALGMLVFAAHYRLRDLWIDAFAHCVGMNGQLSESTEFERLDGETKALITRASLKMDVHIDRVTSALSHFLEDDLSSRFFGLSQGGRAHLDRFRSFLHSFYVEKFGYWPPPRTANFSKNLFLSMYCDFQGLYDLLADFESTDSLQNQKPASGGICVLQNVQAFDKRHEFSSIRHPLPLLPEEANNGLKPQSQRPLLNLKRGTKQAKIEKYVSMRMALAQATNLDNLDITSEPLVRAYQRFEREWCWSPEEKISISDARKIRWIVIYGCLQMLISILRAPKEVRNAQGPTYPLCCLVAGALPWETESTALITDNMTLSSSRSYVTQDGLEFCSDSSLASNSMPPTPATSIRPDCETDDYFFHNHASDGTPAKQVAKKADAPAPLRTSSGSIFRSASFKSLKSLSLPSRRNSIQIKVPTPSFHEILVQGYGNGLNPAIVEPVARSDSLDIGSVPEITVSRSTSSSSHLDIPAAPAEPPAIPPRRLRHKPISLYISHETDSTIRSPPLPERARTPILEMTDLDKIHDPYTLFEATQTRRPSDASNPSLPATPVWASSRSTSPSTASSGDSPRTPDKALFCDFGLARSDSGNSSSSSNATPGPATPLDEFPPALSLAGKGGAGDDTATAGVLIRRSFSLESFLA